jgi:hypothetical protein
MAWCDQIMPHIGAPESPTTKEFFQQRPQVVVNIPSWYKTLVDAARAFNQPIIKLPLLSTPTGAYDWIVDPQVDEAMNRDFDDIDPDLLSDSEEFEEDSEGSDGQEEDEG